MNLVSTWTNNYAVPGGGWEPAEWWFIGCMCKFIHYIPHLYRYCIQCVCGWFSSMGKLSLFAVSCSDTLSFVCAARVWRVVFPICSYPFADPGANSLCASALATSCERVHHGVAATKKQASCVRKKWNSNKTKTKREKNDSQRFENSIYLFKYHSDTRSAIEIV